MDRKRAAAALLALAACIACSSAAPTASNQTALELMDGPTEGCYYNFQHYGEGDRIMTNEPCLNCTCHNRMLMCYLRVCPFTKPIGQDCTVEKRADQCCPIVTCPDVPVDLLTSTSTSSPAEYGTTGVGKLDKYGCSINGKYFSEGSKVPSTPNKPCEHCYCIRNMTTCVMQECTLHVDGCTPIYHKDVCCPVRYSCDHPEDDILLLDDMTTTVRPTPGFLLTTTTATPVTQISQDCVHDDQIFPDGTLIKTEKACEHCYCMKGDIVCVVQECGTPMENEGKNCTSLPPRHGQCCPDTYICEGDDRGTDLTTEIIDQSTQPPRRVGVEGSGYRNEPDELYTEKSPFETDIEGSGEDYATDAPVITVEDGITEKIQPDIIDEMLLATTEKEKISHTEPDKDQTIIPDIISGTESSDLPENEKEQISHTEPDKDKNTIPDIILGTESSDLPEIEKEQISHAEPDKDQNIIPDTISGTESSDLSETEKEQISHTEPDKDRNIIPDVISSTESSDLPETEKEQISHTEPDKDQNTIPDIISGTESSDVPETEKEQISHTEPDKDQNTIPDIISGTESSDVPETEKEQISQTEPDKDQNIYPGINSGTESSDVPETEKEQISQTEPDKDQNIHPDIISVTESSDVPETEKEQISNTESDKDQNIQPDIISGTESSDLPETMAQATEANVEFASIGPESKTTIADEYKTIGLISKEDDFATTESAFRKEDNNIVSDEILTIKEHEKLPTTSVDLVDETTIKDEHLEQSTDFNLPSVPQGTTILTEYTPEAFVTMKEKETTTENLSSFVTTEKSKSEDEFSATPREEIFTSITTVDIDKTEIPETTTANPEINEVDENVLPPGRIPGEGDCLLNGITYRNNTIVPNSNNCHTSCKCISSIIKCDPIICSSPPEYMENMNDCQPIYDSPDACCPTYVCSAKETIPPQSHSQMSGTESPKPITVSDCNGEDCRLNEEQKPIIEPSSSCTSVDCLNKPAEKQDKDKSDCGLNGCADESQKPSINLDCTDNKCQILPVVACEGENCLSESVTNEDTHKTPISENAPSLICNEDGDCKKPDTQHDECKDETCGKQESTETEVKESVACTEPECIAQKKPVLPSSVEQSTDLPPEKISTDKVTQITITELDMDTESPVNTITEVIDENVAETPTPEVTKIVETMTSEELDALPETSSDILGITDKSDHTESPTTQSILEKHEDTKITDQTNIEFVTEPSNSQEASKDEVTKATQTDESTTDKDMAIDETSEHTGIKSEDNLIDKIEITTEHLEIFTDSNVYSTKQEETTVAEDNENQKTHTEVPELDKNKLEKITPTEADVDASEKETTTVKEVSEMHETKEEKTEVPVTIENISTQTEKVSTNFDKATETYESSQVTNEPHEPLVDTDTEKDKIAEEPESQEPHEIITDKNNAEIGDVTQSSETLVTKDENVTTEKSDIRTESHIIPTELPETMQTKLDEVTTKDVSQEIVTDKNEIPAEPSDFFTPHHEEITSELPVHHIDNLSQTQIQSEVTEQPISEKVTTFTESSDTLQTKTEEIIHDFGQPVTEIYTKTPDHLKEKSDEGLTTPNTDQKLDATVTEKEYTDSIEFDTTKKQETFTESPKVPTTELEESITKDLETKIDSSSTELPTLFTTLPETIKVTENQDIVAKETEEPITEKELHFTDDTINTTSETFREPTAEIDQHLTEKSEIAITESSATQTLLETDSYVKPTSGKPNQVDDHDIESQQPSTTAQDNLIAHEITTIAQEPIAMTESQTVSPSLTDEKLHESSTEIQEELPLQTDINDKGTTTQQSPKKSDESSAHPASQSEYTTEHYATESQKIHSTMVDEPQLQLDLSTTPSSFDHKLEESTDKSKPHEETEEILSKETTTSSQDEKEEEGKETTLPIDSETASHDMEKTTASLISGDDKETETQLYTTERNIVILEQETAKTTTGIIIDEEMHETTGKPVSEEEHLPYPTHEYIPSEGITEEITSQTLHDMSTEKTKLQDESVTLAPEPQPELITKSEESGIIDPTIVEKEIVTELPNSYITSEDVNKISGSAEKDESDENTHKYKEDDQEFTTSLTTKLEEDQYVTKAPVSFVPDDDHVTETSMPEKDEKELESTTKTSDDHILDTEKESTMLDSYTTEPQSEISEKGKDETTQRQEIITDKIVTTENPEYLSTLHVHETTLSSSEEKVKVPQQEITTEKLTDHTKPVDDLQPTPTETNAQNTEDISASTTKEDILITEEKTTQKPLEDFEIVTSHSPDYQTIKSVPKDENTSELSNKESTTISSETLAAEKGDNEVTENIIHTSDIDHEIVTEKERYPEPVDIEAHTITTERNGVDIVVNTSPETFPTDAGTDTKEPDVMEKEHDITRIPILTEIPTSTDATKLTTEKQEITQTESITKGKETTDLYYTTVAEQKESSTEASDLRDKSPEHNINDDQKLTTTVPETVTAINEDSEIKISPSTNIPYQSEITPSIEDSQEQLDINDKLTTFVTKDTNIQSTKPTITEKEKLDEPAMYSTQPSELQTEEHVTQKELAEISSESVPTILPNSDITTELPVSTEKHEKPYITEEIKQTTDSDLNLSETTPFLVELEEHTHHMVDEFTTKSSLEEITTTMLYETHVSQQPERGDQTSDDISIFTHSADEYPVSETSKTTVGPFEDKEHPATHVPEQIDEHTVTPLKSETEITFSTEKLPTPLSPSEPEEIKKDSTEHDDILTTTTMSQIVKDKDYTTESIEIQQTPTSTLADVHSSLDKDIHISSEKPLQPEIPEESEEKLTSEIPKETTTKIVEETSTYSPPHIENVTKPKEKPVDTTLRPTIPEVPKPEFIDDNVELPSPDFPPSGGYGQEPDYIDEDQAFGPGTCRYGGKVYVSAQQIPRDDPCDFCFCFRSDIICLQQSCPPPIHGCHEEPIQGFCCPRYECPVSMATTLNVTTTTTTTTTTLPPHFLPHAYKGAAQRRGCQIKGHTYKVGEVVRASSGPCLHCTCGGDGQMKCDPKACTPEPMLRQMIAAAVSAKRRR